MAKKFGENREVDFAAAKLMSFGKSFSRMNGQPLDESEVWYNLADLRTFAASDSAYVGMKVVYVDTANNKVYHYGIELNGELKEIGTSPIGDEKSITVAEDGTVSLYGIEGLALTREVEKDGETVTEKIKYQPLLVDGKLTWVEPSATTVEGLATQIAGLESTIGNLEYRYNGTAEMLVGYKEIEAKVNHMVDDWNHASGIENEGSATINYVASVDNTTTKIVLPPVANYSGVYYPATGIAESVFAGATALETIVIPGTVANIGANAFADCTVLKDVYFGGTKEEWEAVQVAEGNDVLANATVHYNYDGTYNTLYNEVEAIDGKISDVIGTLDYSKVENVGDGKIKIDDTEYTVYAHPNKHAIDEIEGLQDALDGKQAAGDYAAEKHTHIAEDITDLDDTIKAYKYATQDEVAQALKDAKEYADDNDANTTYTIGYEGKVDGEGGHPARIVLTPSEGEAQYVDATPFIKDGMIEKVELSEDGLKIVITWNTDSDKGENNVTELPLGELVDVYTAKELTTESPDEVKVAISNTNEISATLVDGKIAKSKLNADIQASLDLADSALQGVDGENAIDVNITDKNAKVTLKINEAEAGNVVLTQDANGLKANVDLSDYALSDDLHNHANKDLLDTYDQTNADIKDAVGKRHGHDNKTLLDAITDERVAAWDEAEKNLFAGIDNNYLYIDLNEDGENVLTLAEDFVDEFNNKTSAIASVDEAQFAIVTEEGKDRQLTLLDIAQSKIAGLTNKAGEVATLAEVLAEKVDKEEGKGLSANDFTDTLLGKLNGIEAGAQVNVIEGITFNGVAVPVGEDKIANITYTLPIADADTLGGVKSVDAILGEDGKITNAAAIENKITVANDGTMEVNSLNVNKLVQDENTYIIMNGGSASI